MRYRIVILILGVLLVFAGHALAATLGIDTINVIPPQPSDTDLITFNITGVAASASSWVDHDQFVQNGTFLQLDLYIDSGMLQAISNWTYSKQIQPLPLGTYSMEINAFDNSSGPWHGTLQDTHTINFTVTPEPSTLAIFGVGLPIFRYLMKRKI